MQNVDNKREREKVMVSQMIALYCRGSHHTRKGLNTPECAVTNVLLWRQRPSALIVKYIVTSHR